DDGGLPRTWLCLPVLIWAALRFGQRGSATSVTVLALMAIGGVLRRSGSLAPDDSERSLAMLQIFLAVTAVASALLAAMVAERKRLATALQDAYLELGMRFERQR